MSSMRVTLFPQIPSELAGIHVANCLYGSVSPEGSLHLMPYSLRELTGIKCRNPSGETEPYTDSSPHGVIEDDCCHLIGLAVLSFCKLHRTCFAGSMIAVVSGVGGIRTAHHSGTWNKFRPRIRPHSQ